MGQTAQGTMVVEDRSGTAIMEGTAESKALSSCPPFDLVRISGPTRDSANLPGCREGSTLRQPGRCTKREVPLCHGAWDDLAAGGGRVFAAHIPAPGEGRCWLR